MTAPARVLAVIPARAGSKGLPGKNLRTVGGRSLVDRAIDVALQSAFITQIVVSSDSDEVLAVAGERGCHALARRRELATDEAAMIDVVIDAVEQGPAPELVVLLQPTSPLRTTGDVDGVIRMLVDSDSPACVSVSEIAHHAQWMFFTTSSGHLQPVTGDWQLGVRRQDLAPTWALNGAVYAARPEWLREHKSFVTSETLAYEMPTARAIDIDSADDLAQAELMLKEI